VAVANLWPGNLTNLVVIGASIYRLDLNLLSSPFRDIGLRDSCCFPSGSSYCSFFCGSSIDGISIDFFIFIGFGK
jgi:hypothetical protein